MKHEMKSMQVNDVWDLVKLLEGIVLRPGQSDHNSMAGPGQVCCSIGHAFKSDLVGFVVKSVTCRPGPSHLSFFFLCGV